MGLVTSEVTRHLGLVTSEVSVLRGFSGKHEQPEDWVGRGEAGSSCRSSV